MISMRRRRSGRGGARTTRCRWCGRGMRCSGFSNDGSGAPLMSEATHLVLPSPAEERPINFAPALIAFAAIAAGALFLSSRFGWRQSALFGVGAAAGVVLYHAAFGFTSSWRAFVTQRRGAA